MADKTKPVPEVRVTQPISPTATHTGQQPSHPVHLPPPVVFLPPPPPPIPIIFRPSRLPLLAAILGVISGILIIFGTIPIPILGPTQAACPFLLPWMCGFPVSLIFALGLALAVLVFVGAGLIFLHQQIVGGLVVFVGAVLALIAGGGFIVGTVIGIIVALLVLASNTQV